MARKNNPRLIIERILKDAAVRVGITTRSLLWFFRIYLSEYLRYETASFQHEIIRVAERQKHDLVVISAFRGSSKSTLITTAYVLWSILGRQQRKFVVLMSQTEEKTRMHLTNIKRELEENELLRRDLGPFQEERNQWGSYTLIIPKFNAKITISSVEQSVRGQRHNSRRPDLLVVDDAESLESIKTSQGRQKIWDWFTGDVLPAGDRGTRTFVLGNLLAEGSLLETLRRQIRSGEREGVYLEYPIVDERGRPAWPGKFPSADAIEAERRKIGDPIAWAREFMLQIVAHDSQMIDPTWITRYEHIPDDVRYYAVGVDPAISDKTEADSTAIVCAAVVGYGEEQRIYILPNPINRKMTVLETIDTVKELVATLKSKAPVEVYVEDVAYQRALVQLLNSRGLNVHGVRVDGRDKRSRLSPVSYLVQRKEVLFPNIGCDELVQQLTGFPIEKHDDLVDAFSMVGNKIVEKKDLETHDGFYQMVRERNAELAKLGPAVFMRPKSMNDWVLAARRDGF